jgi:hypothetical protein
VHGDPGIVPTLDEGGLAVRQVRGDPNRGISIPGTSLDSHQRADPSPSVWQNRLNYSGSSALITAIQPISFQCTSNGTTHWSIGSPPDTTMVQQD